MMNVVITDMEVLDIRFPTSQGLHGSDAMNQDPDYSAAYVILRTDQGEQVSGHGLTFTIGRGNNICTAAIDEHKHLVIGKNLKDITANMGGFWRDLVSDSQLRWLGPEKGVIHMAAGAIVNAVWDLWAKIEGKPLWKLIADFTPEEFVNCIDFRYLSDAITREDALDILHSMEDTKTERIKDLEENGYPAYTTSVGWLGYSDQIIRDLCHQSLKEGWTNFKMKVGRDIDRDLERAAIIRDIIGYDNLLMMDANQYWDVDEAIENCQKLANYRPYWIEEPTSPDDILGHKKIAENIGSIKVATGEHCQNRVLFKQFITSNALQICQIDSCRVGGVNENLAILLLAAKYKIPVCPHAGGVGLCEHVQHLSMIDYICVSGSKEGRMIEYVDHLHEHFVDPVRINSGHYLLPQMPGYSIEMKRESRDTYQYPNGHFWQENPDLIH